MTPRHVRDNGTVRTALSHDRGPGLPRPPSTSATGITTTPESAVAAALESDVAIQTVCVMYVMLAHADIMPAPGKSKKVGPVHRLH